MRHALLAVVAAALAVGAALPAQAQGTFPLKYQEAGESDSLVSSLVYHRGSNSPPEGLKAPPRGLSGNAMYFSIRGVLVVVDKTSPPRFSGRGNPSRAPPLPRRRVDAGRPRESPPTCPPGTRRFPEGAGRVR
jgi:hypothetical protein